MAKRSEPAGESDTASEETAQSLDGADDATTSEESDDGTEAPDVFAGDDPKAKFREALARKHGGGGTGGGGAGGGSKISSTHGPAKAARTFRRKSGG